MAIYITSDYHFGHDKEFIYAPRGFKSEKEMTETLISSHNSIVNSNDDVYFLGDLIVGNTDENFYRWAINSLNGRLHLIRGNHDSTRRMKIYAEMPNIAEICDAKFLDYNKWHFFLCHYPALVENKAEKLPLAVVSLCGHSHTKDKFADFDKGLIYHCEVDAHDNKPVLLDNIIKELKMVQKSIPKI